MFAQASHDGMGTLDWADVETMVDEAVKQGIANPDKLAIAGHSQGGFLAAWACGRTHRFKAAVVSAGISDWGSLTLGNDMPDLEVSAFFVHCITFPILCFPVRPPSPVARRGLPKSRAI